MSANDRQRSRGQRRAQRIRLDLASELLHARLQAALSQDKLGALVGMSGDKVGRIERAELATLSIPDAAQLGAVLGLDLAVRLYPSGYRIRDEAQARRLAYLTSFAAAPLRTRLDVPLPQLPDSPREVRAWDCVFYEGAERTTAELESRITDFQAMTRRHELKRRDDPGQSFLLVVADTEHNRRIMREYATLLADLPRLGTADVMQTLRAGHRPSTGWIFLGLPPRPRPLRSDADEATA